MMKAIINKTLMAMLALLPFLAACQSDPDVGTPLYPVEEEDMSPKLYVYSGALEGNVTESTVVNTPSGLIVPGDTLRFYVQLTRALSQDVIVNVALDAEKAAEFDETGETIGEDALSLLTSQVTIPAGATISTEEIVVAINESAAAVANFQKYGVLALVLSTPSNASIAKDYGAYYWKLYKETLNVYASTSNSAEIEGLTEIAKGEWTLETVSTSYANELTDGTISSYNYGMVTIGSGSMTYVFDSPRTVKAYACLPPQYRTYFQYGLGDVKVETSNDGTTWESHGTLTLPAVTATSMWSVVNFYSPVTAKYFRYTPLSRASGATTGAVYIGEMKIYE